jgi:hypothetical protein
MNGTTSFGANDDDQDGEPAGPPQVDTAGCGAPPGGSAGQGDRRSSFLGHPTQSFLSARDPEIETAYGSCRSRGRQERAHRSLENRTERGFPQLPQAPSSPTKCHPCSRFTLLPIFPVAHTFHVFSRPYQANYLPTMCSGLLFSHTNSINSSCGARSHVRFMFQGFVNVPGSSKVTRFSRCPKSTRR